MKSSLLKRVLLKRSRNIDTLMADQDRHFDIDQLILSIQNYFNKYPITIREMLKFQNVMKTIRTTFDNEDRLSNIEEIDLNGHNDSEDSGSSEDSGACGIPFRGWEYHELDEDQKIMILEEISKDIRLYFPMMHLITEKLHYVKFLLYTLTHADKRSFKSFAYLF